MHGKFVLLPFSAQSDKTPVGLSPRELDTLASVSAAPQPYRKVAHSLPAQRAIHSLQRKGLIQVSSFTPSDAGHVLGLQDNWSMEGATLAAQLAARLRDMKMPTPERTRKFAHDVWAETVRLSGMAILQTAFGTEVPHNALIDAVCSGAGALGLAQVGIKPSVPVVAVGGPVRVFYEEVQRRLGCEIAFPQNCDVANAIGAATGVVAHTVTVRVVGDGTGTFRMHSSAATRQFSNATEALNAASELAEQLARDAVLDMGAQTPRVKVSTSKQWMPNAVSDAGLLEAVVVAEAMGRPNAAA
jgi:N-methylhydantoinase A/oxoprolinase/acetone carboxylase beta subunit